MTSLETGGVSGARHAHGRSSGILGPAALIFCGLAVAGASRFALSRFGPDGFLIALVIAVGLVLYSLVSFRNLSVPFLVWFVAIGGFRFLWAIQAPVLPDMTLDRITMVWLTVILMVRFVVERRALQRFGILEYLLIAHALYLLARVAMDDMLYFRIWSQSFLIPYAAYFFARNIIDSNRRLNTLLGAMLVLSIYYNVTAVAEKMHWSWLLWPAEMREPAGQFIGRSSGPFRQAPLFGTVIGMMLPLHLYFLARARATFLKALILVSFLVGVAGLYFTYTRGSWLAGFAALAVAGGLNRRQYLPVVVGGLIVASIGAVTVLGISQDKFLKKRVGEEKTVETRIGIGITAFRVWQSHPLFGVGFFRYRTTYDDFLHPTSVPGYGTIHLRQVRDISLHDIYLGPLAEDGLVGFTLQFSIYGLVFAGLLKRLRGRRDDDDLFRNMVLPVFAGIYVGYLVGGLAIDYRYFSFVGALFYVAAGIQEGYDVKQRRLAGDPAPEQVA